MADSSAGAPAASGSASDAALLAIVEEFSQRVRAGEEPDAKEYAARLPERAQEVRELLSTVSSLEQAQPREAQGATAAPHPTRIGDYRIEREIGRGGMGVVLLATQESLDRKVALKLLPVQATLDPRYLERFRREARAAARLSHPSIVPVFGVGEEQGLHFFVMQYVEGHSLDEVVRALSSAAGRTSGSSASRLARRLWARELSSGGRLDEEEEELPGSEAEEPRPEVTASDPLHDSAQASAYFRNVARIGLQVAEALAYAHSHGILHRDVKPGNVMLDGAGRVWISDFGLCKTADADQLTMASDVVGTLRYMAPEQVRGRSDVRSDVYGLGVTLHELLARHSPFEAKDRAELLNQVLTTTLRRLRKADPRIPADLETIVQTATAKLPEERYGTAEALADDLRAFLEERPIAARPPSTAYLLRLAARRHRGLLATAAAALTIVIVLTALYLVNIQRSRREQRRQLYVASIAAAQASIDVDSQAVADYLERAPAEHRNWEWHHLRALLDQSLRTLEENHGTIRVIDYTPDGRLELVTLGPLVRVRERGPEGREWTLEGCRTYANAAAISPDGTRVVAADAFGRAFVWALEDPPRRIGTQDVSRADTVYVDAEGRVYLGLREGVVRIMDETLTTVVGELGGHSSWISDIDETPEGRLVTSSFDGDLRVWNRNGETERVLRHGAQVHCIALDPSGTLVASGDKEAGIQVWDLERGTRIQELTGHSKPVYALAFGPGGRTLVSSSADRTIRVWDVEAGHELRVLRGHRHWIETLAFRPDDGLLVSAGRNGTIKEWDVEAGGGELWLTGHAAGFWNLEFDRESRRLVVASRDASVRVWDAWNGENLRTFFPRTGARAATFSLDGRLVAAGDVAGRIHIWELERGTLLAAFESLGESRARPAMVRGISFEDGGTLHAGLERWGVETWVQGDEGWHQTDFEPEPELSKSGLSPAGAHLAIGSYDGRVRLLRLPEREVVFEDQEHEGEVLRVVFDRDGEMLATSGIDGRVVLRRVNDGAVLRTLRIEPRSSYRGSQVWTVGFSPDGSRLLTSSAQVGTSLWDMERDELTLRILGSVNGYERSAFSPDGRCIVEVFSSGRMRILDTISSAARRSRTGSTRPLDLEAERVLAGLGDAARDLDGLPTLLDELDVQGALFQAVLARAHAAEGTRTALMRRCRRLLRRPGRTAVEEDQAAYLADGFWRTNVADPESNLLYGEAQYRRGSYPSAVEFLETAVRATEDGGPLAFDARVFLAMNHARQGRLPEALDLLARAEALAQIGDEEQTALLAEAMRTLDESEAAAGE